MPTMDAPLEDGTYIIYSATTAQSQPASTLFMTTAETGTITNDLVITANSSTKWDVVSVRSADAESLYNIRVHGQQNAYAYVEAKNYASGPDGVFVENKRESYDIVRTSDGYYKIRVPSTQEVFNCNGSNEQVTAVPEAKVKDLNQEWIFELLDSVKSPYESYKGFFVQDDLYGNAKGVQVYPRFGLKDEYTWPDLWQDIENLNNDADSSAVYKVIFLGRHGHGVHNYAMHKYGKDWHHEPKEWCKKDGDGVITWVDAELARQGHHDVQIVNAMWISQLADSMGLPQLSLTSPLTRCMVTNTITFSELDTDTSPATTLVVENCREKCTQETPEERRTRTYIATVYPQFAIEDGFAEDDPIWKPDEDEPNFSGRVLDVLSTKIFDDDDTAIFVSITTHSGWINEFMRIIGRKKYSMPPGGVVPVVVKYTKPTSDD